MSEIEVEAKCFCGNGEVEHRGDGGYSYGSAHELCGGTGRVTLASLSTFVHQWGDAVTDGPTFKRYATALNWPRALDKEEKR